MSDFTRRRAFITLLGGAAAAWPLAARAQQAAIPVIGYLSVGSPESDASRLTGLRRGLNQTGYVEGRSLVIEYRWAGNQADRLPALAADPVQRRVAVIIAAGGASCSRGQGCDHQHSNRVQRRRRPCAARACCEPRPRGNLTGSNGFIGEFGARSLALLHELVSSAPV